MKIAVIVPTYQKRKSLGNLLVSLDRQTFKDFGVIIVNNSDTSDGSCEFITSICGAFKDLKVTVLNPGANLGAGGGRNFAAFSNMADDYQLFAFIDDDCVASEDWLQVAYRQFSNETKTKVIFGTVTSDITPRPPFIHGFDMQGGVFGSGNCVIEKKFFKKINGFDEYLNNWAEDFEFGERCRAQNEAPIYVKDLLVNHPPKLINYKLFSHLLSPTFFKKYLYLVCTKGYEYKSKFRINLLKRGLIRFFVFIPMLGLIYFHCVFFISPFIVHFLIQARKLPNMFKTIKTYPFEDKLKISGVMSFLLFHWIIDILNAILVVFYKLPLVERLLLKQIDLELDKRA